MTQAADTHEQSWRYHNEYSGEVKSNRLSDLVVFFVPFFGLISIKAIGQVYLSELILLMMFPALIHRVRYILAPTPAKFVSLGAVWLIGQIITDIIRETPFVDFSRGWSKIILTMVLFCIYYLLIIGSARRIVLGALGFVGGGLINLVFNPPSVPPEAYWKFGIGSPINLLVVLLMTLRPFRAVKFLPSIIIGLLGIFNLLQNARSLAGMLLVTAIYMILADSSGRRSAIARPSALRTFSVILAGLFAIVALINLYGFGASQGWFGEQSRAKYLDQSGGQFGILLGGRTEIIVSSQAIMDSPLIGHGSWAKNPKYKEELLRLIQLGYDFDEKMLLEFIDSDLIPTHSHIFGAWVESGLAGLIFWSFSVLLTIRVITSIYLIDDPLVPFIAYLSMASLWDIFFSPFGAQMRMNWAFVFCVLCYAWSRLQQAFASAT